MQNTPEVQEQIKMASDASEQGNYDQALRILGPLHESQKIQMQETQQNVSVNGRVASVACFLLFFFSATAVP